MPSMRIRQPELLNRVRGCVPYDALLKAVRTGEHEVNLEGPVGAVRGLVAAALAHDLDRPVVVVTPDLESARDLAGDVEVYLGAEGVDVLPDRDLAPYEPGPVSPQLAGLRLRTLSRLPELQTGVVVTTAAALQEALPPPSRLKAFELELMLGQEVDREHLLHHCVAAGYRRVDVVELAGDFSVRGAVLDVSCPSLGRPLRIELEGDVIAGLRYFDADSQRSLEALDRARIGAAAEALLTAEERLALLDRLPDPLVHRGGRRVARLRERLETGASLDGEERYLPWLLGAPARLNAYMPDHAVVVVVEPRDGRDSMDRLFARTNALYEELTHAKEPLPEPGELLATPEAAWRDLGAGRPRICVRQFSEVTPGRNLAWPAKPYRFGVNEFSAFLKELARWRQDGTAVTVFCESTEERDALTGRLKEAALLDPAAKPPTFVEGRLSAGAGIADARLVLLPARDVLGQAVRRVAARKVHKAYRDAFADLKPGDHVVHEDYGIGLYQGVMSIPIEGVRQDFFLLEYAEKEKLYLPADQAHRVQKYLGTAKPPPLSRLGSEVWEKTKARVQASLRLFAEGLLKLYSERQVAHAGAFPSLAEADAAIEATFPYEETPDQAKAIKDVLDRLAIPKPMDLLVCGDVGYGKTEVAIRAAFRVAAQGSQVAVLVPTTILAQQHYQSFSSRMAGLPVRVEMLSRFRDPRDRKRVMEDVAAGKVDIVVGTHTILAASLKFKNIGLVVVDEEHRFGVKQKEKLKELKRNIHVLTMSATPIPRTLNMGFAGLRDLSVIETAPPGRMSVLTHVHEENLPVVREAVLRELKRGGQVFYLHNRVQGIPGCAQRLKELVPEARLAVAHGQMPLHTLEKAMTEFTSGRADVLVCTSIIGAGLDLPNANTLIVERAELFGLADLYQLRGRVGRSSRQAYAYFFFSPHGAPTLDARRRLSAMLEFGELGSGFRLAVRDMEIRGAGNLLGPQQHGVMHAVGFDLYTRMLDSAVRGLKGEVVVSDVPPQITLGLETYLPEAYVADGRSKLEIYKRLGACAAPGEVAALLEELRDRFGDPPPPVRLLAAQAEIRMFGAAVNLASVTRQGAVLTLVFRIRAGLQHALRGGTPKGWRVDGLKLTVPAPPTPEGIVGFLKELLRQPGPGVSAVTPS